MVDLPVKCEDCGKVKYYHQSSHMHLRRPYRCRGCASKHVGSIAGVSALRTYHAKKYPPMGEKCRKCGGAAWFNDQHGWRCYHCHGETHAA